jgi:transposase-like protein
MPPKKPTPFPAAALTAALRQLSGTTPPDSSRACAALRILQGASEHLPNLLRVEYKLAQELNESGERIGPDRDLWKIEHRDPFDAAAPFAIYMLDFGGRGLRPVDQDALMKIIELLLDANGSPAPIFPRAEIPPRRFLVDAVRAGMFAPPDEAVTTTTPAPVAKAVEPEATGGYFSHSALAKRHGVDSESLRKRLDRWRKGRLDGFTEQTERGPRDPKFIYIEAVVLPVIQKLKQSEAKREREKNLDAGKLSNVRLPVAGQKRPAKRPAKKY